VVQVNDDDDDDDENGKAAYEDCTLLFVDSATSFWVVCRPNSECCIIEYRNRKDYKLADGLRSLLHRYTLYKSTA